MPESFYNSQTKIVIFAPMEKTFYQNLYYPDCGGDKK